MGFAGSMTVRPSTLIALIRDYVLSLARHGFRAVLLHQRPRRQHRHHAGGLFRDLRRDSRAPSASAATRNCAAAWPTGGTARPWTRAEQGTVRRRTRAATRPQARCRSRNTCCPTQSVRCRSIRRARQADGSMVRPTTAGAFRTAASAPIRGSPRRKRASGCTSTAVTRAGQDLRRLHGRESVDKAIPEALQSPSHDDCLRHSASNCAVGEQVSTSHCPAVRPGSPGRSRAAATPAGRRWFPAARAAPGDTAWQGLCAGAWKAHRHPPR